MRIGILANVPLNQNQGSGYVICGYAQALKSFGHLVSLQTTFPRNRLPRGKGNGFRTRLGMIKALPLARHNDALLLWGGEAGWVVPRLKIMHKRGVVIACSNGLDTHYMQARGTPMQAVSQHPSNSCFRDLDGLMMVSNFDGCFAKCQNYLSEDRRIVISNSLPREFIGRQLPNKRSKLVLFVGNWLPNKGESAILNMIKQISCKVDPPRIRLIGAGTSKAFDELKLTNLETIDPGVSRRDLIRHYEEASILVMPSQYESFGMVASEAMACGCAVVATRTGFPYELEHQRELLHVPFGDESALARAIQRLLEDDQLRQRISEAGYHRVQELTWERAGLAMGAFVQRIHQLGRR